MTNHYTIVTAWIDSCETIEQLNTVHRFALHTLITDDKQRDDILEYIRGAITRRSWVAAKVAQRDYQQVERFPACDEYHEEQPTDLN